MTATANATPAPTPTPEPPLPPDGGGFGFGIGDLINNQINAWFTNLVALAIKPLLELLAVTLLATPDVVGNERAFDLWKATVVIADSGFVVLATIGAIAAMGHETVQTRYAVKEVLPRLLVTVLAVNASFTVCGKAIELANALSRALLGQDFDGMRAVATLRLLIITGGQQAIFYILLTLVAVILLIVLLIAYVMRAALVLLLVVAAPLALACLALPYTDGLARFWARAFTGLLIAQVAQSLTLILAVRIFFNQDGRLPLGLMPSGQLVNLVLVLCLLIILVRIPGWVSRRIFAQTGGRGSTITRIVKYAVAYKLTSPILNALHLGRGGRGGGRGGKGNATRTATRSATVAMPAIAAGPAGTAATYAATRLTGPGGHTARATSGPSRQSPTAGRRPRTASPNPGAHPSGSPGPIKPTTPVYGYPRETYYANGPAGLAQMYYLRTRPHSGKPPRSEGGGKR
ncbi:conjugal transfer protein TrbL family protein [Spongiactinospora sp. TRM90649]|uniref:conjugal transfer protein TrbL family protein n=1 Tax=Spongiactinospora sp. TRM90649 TaxID=3031114 RepID=UPI0023FA17E5|nr:conjugal transfer protein TrbL family protein [Spongiactinospora sp. TRM90649]MDF5757606.1 hypothetical protein [Spongiactinospora sp. TRM90649]